MDNFLIDYLKSGRAWVLVGSGPSIAMGYPSWQRLAESAIETLKTERRDYGLDSLQTAMKKNEFTVVFEEVKNIIGAPRLLQALKSIFTPSKTSEIYSLIARWPVPVYLTTNYDDEIHNHLAKLGEAYIPYSNSEDHFSHLLPNLNGAIVKLHGDLRSENGLILSTSDYTNITETNNWEYWRVKMTSIFQMNRVVVIGHSLTDKNIRHVLETAKKGAGVLQPICWIAPDVPDAQKKEYLDNYRIRIISYDNRDGQHKHLIRLIENISEFIPPRTAVHIQKQIAELSETPLGENAAAPGFFVFNKLLGQKDYEEKRIDVIISAIQSTLPVLSLQSQFTLKQSLEVAGWPKGSSLSPELSQKIEERAISLGILEHVNNHFRVGKNAEAQSSESKVAFEHMRERFKKSLQLRIKRFYPALTDSDALEISSDIESSLTGYFREGGLSLATILFSNKQPSITLPSSIIKFISDASARYDDLLKRQAFVSVSTDAFAHAESAERDYLGRISQGFFAFHSLGVFGEVAIERLMHAKETVWLMDSNVLISAIALASSTNHVFKDCISRLHAAGVRLFTTEKLCDEAHEHLYFADNKVIKQYGSASPEVIAASTGQVPFRKSNLFLEGFVRWKSVGNSCDWGQYLLNIFGERNPKKDDFTKTLNRLGVEVIAFNEWPGFKESDLSEYEECASKIIEVREGRQSKTNYKGTDFLTENDFLKKAQPEAEALIIIKKEREGNFYILSKLSIPSQAWFISQTSILNSIERGAKITWQPDAFLSFASTLSTQADISTATSDAFETLLWNLAQSGLSLLDEKIISSVFGGIIDQATLKTTEEQQRYKETIEEKYGEPIESVLARVHPSNRPLASIQLANEIAQQEAKRAKLAEAREVAASKRATDAEKKLKEVERYRKKMDAKKERGRRKAKKQKSKKK